MRASLALLCLGLVQAPLPADDTCLLFAARCIGQGQSNFYLYHLFSSERILLLAGDRLEYDVFVHSSCPEPKGGIDIQLDRGSMRDSGAVDGQRLRAHGDTALERGRWLHRTIDLSHLAGRTTERWDLQCEGDTEGLYVQFVDEVVLARKDGSRLAIYSGGRPSRDQVDWREGYSRAARTAVIPREQVVEGAELDRLLAAELRVMRLQGLAEQERLELERVSSFVQEADSALAKALAVAAKGLPDPESFEGTEEDFLAALHRASAGLDGAHDLMQSFTGHLVGHAHIDFQWLWEWPETIEVCRQTFGQAVRFMDEVPGFTFSQSSAALYLATEENHPEIFEQIRRRVEEGRWELVGGRWCEGDNNLISGESHARHFLYGQRYFRSRFGRTATVGWEPDTFGHCWTMPQILKLGGIDSYYFCRAGRGVPLFWWEGPDGSQVLAFEEPAIEGGWYNGDVGPRLFGEMLEFRHRVGPKDMLWVYGVGNHGGGPTRESIAAALGWQTQRNRPAVRFSTAGAFFAALRDSDLGQVETVRGELNTVFEGCYTTHADMKRANRQVEALTVAAEAAAAIAGAVPREEIAQTWRDALWNHHHDTLPGTSIHASYGLSRTMYERGIASSRRILHEAVGTLAARSAGRAGQLLVFNPLGWARDAAVTAPWPAGLPADRPVVAKGPHGAATPAQRTAEGDLVFAARALPAWGYRIYRLETAESGVAPAESLRLAGWKLETPRAELAFDPQTGTLVRLFDRALGRNVLAGPTPELVVDWEAPHGGSAWTIGQITGTAGLEVLAAPRVVEAGPVRLRLRTRLGYGGSTLELEVAVYRDLGPVEISLEADWREVGDERRGSPFLRARFPLAVDGGRARYAIPFGDIERPLDGREVPALSWADLGNEDFGVAVLNDSKHGYSARDRRLTLSLVRASYEPDPLPDVGQHRVRLALLPHQGSVHDARIPWAGFEHESPPVAVWLAADGAGALPAEVSFLAVEGALPTALKLAEDGDDWVVRFYEATGSGSVARLPGFGRATEVDFIEDPLGEADAAAVPLRGYEIKTLRVGRP